MTGKFSFKEKLLGERALIGTLVTLAAPEISEIIGMAGYDWVFVDMEHGAISALETQRLLQACPPSLSSLVRVPDSSEASIKKALDLGCDGIIVPQVNTPEQAARVVQHAKFPPVGARSVGFARAHGYGLNFQEYISSANEKVALIAQAEHIDAVKNIDAIVRVDGIDGILIGPYDLSGSMDMIGEVAADAVQGAISTVKSACRRSGMPFGIFVMQPEAVNAELRSGCSFIAVGIDTAIYASQIKANLKAIKDG